MEGFLPHLLLFFLDFKAKDGSAHPFSLGSSWWPVSLQSLVHFIPIGKTCLFTVSGVMVTKFMAPTVNEKVKNFS